MSYTALSYMLLDSNFLANLPLGPTVAMGAFLLIGMVLYIRSLKKPVPTMADTVQTVGTGQEPVVPHMTITPVEAEGFSDDVIAAITAAIAASLKTSTSNIVIRNIKPAGQNVPVWGMMGRTEQVNSRF